MSGVKMMIQIDKCEQGHQILQLKNYSHLMAQLNIIIMLYRGFLQIPCLRYLMVVCWLGGRRP